MNFKIYVIGDIKDKFYKEAIKEYDKRLSRYCKIKIIKLKNADTLKKELSTKTYVILISTAGQLLSSVELANKINELGVRGKSDVSIIYVDNGISIDIEPNEHISLSKMSMDIGLATTIIYEQIYRAYRILNNQPYHK